MLHYIRALGWGFLGGLVRSFLGAVLAALIAGITLITSDSLEEDPLAVAGMILIAFVLIGLSFLCGFSFGMHIGVSRPRTKPQ
jgi:hypothetical protein